jgi:hypothetical protein
MLFGSYLESCGDLLASTRMGKFTVDERDQVLQGILGFLRSGHLIETKRLS